MTKTSGGGVERNTKNRQNEMKKRNIENFIQKASPPICQ